ncbi:glycosyltransferase [Pararhodobacter sp. SW119]|uniref:glycosyltransferase n=1 Tax=Pararhodobacter sp. SW119 TaxID=2780075 RepID=UPI002476E898|nr:glycosyltransferase [Pararhodobacter sp. SW119]
MVTVHSSCPPREHVSILMCTLNGARWLPAQLDSLLGQSHQDWSLWVSDDGSIDGTHAVLAEFANRHPGRVARILKGPQKGSAANFLQLLCHPELPAGIVALADQDDVWFPHKLSSALQVLRQSADSPCAWAARYRVVDIETRGEILSARWARGPSFANAVVQNILSGHTLTMNRAAVQIVRRAGVQAVPHHDWWLYLLFAACDARIVADGNVVLDYRQHDTNAMGIRSTHQARSARLASLLDGRLRDWIAANMAALNAANVPLTPVAEEFARRWPSATPLTRLQLMREFGVHRQSSAETALIHLAAAIGKL